jgi:prephenate dehydratase
MKMKISFLKPLGTFSHEFANDHYGSGIEPVLADDFDNVVKQVAEGEADAGVIPFLNSSGVSVEKAQKALGKYAEVISISGCYPKEIHHQIVVKDDFLSLKSLVSKEEVFPQVKAWMEQWSDIKQVAAPSTAAALQDLLKGGVYDSKDTAVICNQLAVTIYGGEIKHENVQNPNNLTLFLVIEKCVLDGEKDVKLLALVDPTKDKLKAIKLKIIELKLTLEFTSLKGEYQPDLPIFLEVRGACAKDKLMDDLGELEMGLHFIGQYEKSDSIGHCVSMLFK